MLNNARQLLHLINQLLDLSKLESRNMKLRVRCENIVAFLKGVVRSFAALAESKKLTLRFHGEDENLELYFDRDHLEKVFYNLLLNAIKFTPEGGEVIVDCGLGNAEFGTKQKESSAVRNPQSAIITVRDTGIGIPADQLPFIFDRFYQVDNSHTREHGGTGIGLAIIKELVELHRGTISVQSEVGKGTEFVVCLPMGKAHFKPEEIVSEQLSVVSDQLSVTSNQLSVTSNQLSVTSNQLSVTSNQSSENTDQSLLSSIKDRASSLSAAEIPNIQNIERSETNSQPPATSNQESATSRSEAEIPISRDDEDIILIIDDHREMRDFIRERLEPKYKIVEANNGQEGLEMAKEFVPDLIICDIMMPKRDGYELCRLLKSDQRTSHIPIILLTAKAGEESKVHGLETGADDYITKPFSAKELRARAGNLINLRRSLRERFCRQLVLQPSQIVTPSMDGEFLQRVLAVVEKHLEEEEFGVEALAHEVAMSRTQLHRKLRALTNQSASFLIRSIRLQRAADLLRQKAGTVTEIAYRVGFSSPTYFAKCFKEHFGYSPGELKNGEAESSHNKIV
jgi:DNA-binding response OmpR family regulator/two-component sensor histidine kinase